MQSAKYSELCTKKVYVLSKSPPGMTSLSRTPSYFMRLAKVGRNTIAMVSKMNSFTSLKTAQAYQKCLKNALGSNDRFKIYHDLTSKTRFCAEHQRVCKRVLKEDRFGWMKHLVEYVLRIELVDNLFTD